MNKSELIEKVAGATNLSKVDVDSVLKAVLATVVEEVAKGRKVTLVGFGTFEQRKRKARVGVNPQKPTERIKIPAKKTPAFSAGSEFKTSVQTGKAPGLKALVAKAKAKTAAAKKPAAKKPAAKKPAAKKPVAKKTVAKKAPAKKKARK
ncbi:MAG: HU family DNA-binding protein [Candidatus Caenarcaniphilales bacterium]|nr:HU family DNA-binding protein [Candidatus Caenarcaniphilales bacterium]